MDVVITRKGKRLRSESFPIVWMNLERMSWGAPRLQVTLYAVWSTPSSHWVLLLNLKAMQCGYTANRWLTFNQARALGANVRRGEHGTEVVLFKMLDVPETAKPVPAAPAEDDRKVIPLIRSFTVFNASQVDGLPEGLVPPPREVSDWEGCEAAETLISASGASIQYGGSKAFYAPSMDLIQLPDRVSFVSSTAYYQVALHELSHWTGAPHRCNRPLLGRAHIESYAYEELVAELGSAFLCNHCGLPGVTQHASYIESWLKALRDDKKLIFSAASLAQKAADFLINPVFGLDPFPRTV
jgi:antirestriction protein ArdC